MKAKIICILVMTLLITTTLSVVGQTNDSNGFVDANKEMLPNKAGTPITETFYSTSSDGDIYYLGAFVDYEDIWNHATGNVRDGNPHISIGHSSGSGTVMICRGFVYFDTSSLPDTVTIDSAVLSLYGYEDHSDHDFSIVVQNGQPTYPHDPLQAGDYARTHYSGNGGSFNTQYFTTSGYNDIDLNSDGISWINKEGTTKLCLRNNNEINGNEPYDGYFQLVNVKASEGGSGPKLTIEYTNNPPNRPSKPYGPTEGNPNVEYTYTTSTTDPEGEQVYYQWKWGDGTQSIWYGPFNSGEETTAKKIWTSKGTYSITVKAKDINDAESDWSEPLSVTIPRGKTISNPFLQFLQCYPNLFPLLQKLIQQHWFGL